jgi:hypothetical protein
MTDDPSLAAEFPPASREDWLKLVKSALKERPFERLIAKTYDGIPIEPLYGRAADAAISTLSPSSCKQPSRPGTPPIMWRRWSRVAATRRARSTSALAMTPSARTA